MCVDGGENPQLSSTKHGLMCGSQSPPGMSWEIKPMGMNRGPLGTVAAVSVFVTLKDLSSVSCAHAQWNRPASTYRRAGRPC